MLVLQQFRPEGAQECSRGQSEAAPPEGARPWFSSPGRGGGSSSPSRLNAAVARENHSALSSAQSSAYPSARFTSRSRAAASTPTREEQEALRNDVDVVEVDDRWHDQPFGLTHRHLLGIPRMVVVISAMIALFKYA
jgi:hypothetical protein